MYGFAISLLSLLVAEVIEGHGGHRKKRKGLEFNR